MRLQPTQLVSTLQPLICFPSADPSIPLHPLSHAAVSLSPLSGPPLSALFYLLHPFMSLPLHLSAPSLCLPSPLTPFIFSCLPLICLPVHLPLAFHPFSSSLPYIFSLTLHSGPNLFPRPPPASSLPRVHSWKENWCCLKCEILISALAE